MPALSTTRPLGFVCLLTNELLNKSVFDFVQRAVIAAPEWPTKQKNLPAKSVYIIRFTSSIISLSRN
jgi:hypothetical protein